MIILMIILELFLDVVSKEQATRTILELYSTIL